MAENHRATVNILVIDDEEEMRQGCRRALAPEGHAINTAPDLVTGQRLARSGSYDLYLLELMLPDGSGLELIESILHQDPTAICIVMTDVGSLQMAIEAVRQGAYDFLSKPFASDELLMAVRRGLESQRLKRIEARAEELVQAKAELERLDELKSQLMLRVAHELRAPVAAVQSYVNLIISGYVTANELKPTLTRVQDRLQEMLDLISDLLELARLRQVRQQAFANVSPQPTADILKDVCDLFREQAREKQQDFQVNILDEPIILADKEHLRQIWTNLISNAIKYTPECGTVQISLESDAGKLIGTVADSGIGINEEDVPNLFQDFYRTDQAKASGQAGTGLGLSIVKQIVDSYGGEINLVSGLDQGTSFTFILPPEPSTEIA